jgi:WD40 repeat protein
MSVSYHWFKSPVFSLAARRSNDEGDIVFAAGGGGSSKTGIQNVIAVLGLEVGEKPLHANSSSIIEKPSNSLIHRYHEVTTDDVLILNLSLSPCGTYLVGVGTKSSCSIYRVNRGVAPSLKLIKSLTVEKEQAESTLSCVAWHPCGTIVAIASESGYLYMYKLGDLIDAETEQSSQEAKIKIVDGSSPLKLEREGKLQILSISSEIKRICTFSKGHVGGIESISFSKDGEKLVSVGQDRTVLIYNLGAEFVNVISALMHGDVFQCKAFKIPMVGPITVGNQYAPRKSKFNSTPDAGKWGIRGAFLASVPVPASIKRRRRNRKGEEEQNHTREEEEEELLYVLESSSKGSSCVTVWSFIESTSTFKTDQKIPTCNTISLDITPSFSEDADSVNNQLFSSTSGDGGKAENELRHRNQQEASKGRESNEPAASANTKSLHVKINKLVSKVPLSTWNKNPFDDAIICGSSDGSLIHLDPRSLEAIGAKSNVHGFPITSIEFLPFFNTVVSGAADAQVGFTNMELLRSRHRLVYYLVLLFSMLICLLVVSLLFFPESFLFIKKILFGFDFEGPL